MKIDELMIGNYVKYRGQIGQTVNKTVQLSKLYQPILLTDQQLLDFGFKRAKEEKDWFSIKTEIPFINLEISIEEKRCILFNRKKIVYTDIFFPKYVHNVQNLYFALTRKKLTR